VRQPTGRRSKLLATLGPRQCKRGFFRRDQEPKSGLLTSLLTMSTTQYYSCRIKVPGKPAMLLHLSCASCVAVVRIHAEDSGDIPRCPRCGQRLVVISSSDGEPTDARPRIDDDIVSWLSQSSDSSERDAAGDATCQRCGYAGMIRGDAVCPVCLEVNPIQTAPGPPTVDCPNCGQPIALLQNDRGKTTICPGCKYFLGCVLPAPKHVYRKQRAGR
jgi:uncharacterized paraquat-inducible protein A